MPTILDYKKHVEETQQYIDLLLFHEQTLIRETGLLKPKLLSPIANGLEIDVVQISNASKEVIEARKTYYYACMELLQIKATIIAQKELLNTYRAHVEQELTKQAKPCTNEMIKNALSKAKALANLSTEEKGALKGVSADLSKILNSGKERRVELLETLQNIITQHGAY